MTKQITEIDSAEELKAIADELGIVTKVINMIGGMDGGNCWGNEPYRIEPDSEEMKEVDFDHLLTVCFPEITFLQFRKLMRGDILIYREWTENEYYGNYFIYRSQEIDFDVLFNALKKLVE